MKTTFSPAPDMTAGDTNAAGKGHLVIIGGGERPDDVMRKIISLAGPESRMVIIPLASDAPLEVARSQKRHFEQQGADHVDYIDHDRLHAESNLERVRNATGVFFSGGDQRKLAKSLHGSALLEEIRKLYLRGGVVSGTSAGAAVMSRVMITGDEYPNADGSSSGQNPTACQCADAPLAFTSIQARKVMTGEGFGFIENAIIDQHFVKRKRHNRLMSLVLENPGLLGIGIDEATAIVVNPDNIFEVVGDSQVLVFDASSAKDIRPHQGAGHQAPLSAHQLTVHLLASSNRYHLGERQRI